MGRSLVCSGSIMVKMGYFMDLTGPSDLVKSNPRMGDLMEYVIFSHRYKEEIGAFGGYMTSSLDMLFGLSGSGVLL